MVPKDYKIKDDYYYYYYYNYYGIFILEYGYGEVVTKILKFLKVPLEH